MRVVRRFIACFQTDEAGVAVGYLPYCIQGLLRSIRAGGTELFRVGASPMPPFALASAYNRYGTNGVTHWEVRWFARFHQLPAEHNVSSG